MTMNNRTEHKVRNIIHKIFIVCELGVLAEYSLDNNTSKMSTHLVSCLSYFVGFQCLDRSSFRPCASGLEKCRGDCRS